MENIIGETLLDAHGNKITTRSLTGPDTFTGLLFVWSQSIPCIQYVPKVIEFYHNYHNKRATFNLIIIAEETSYEAWKNYREATPVPMVPYDEISKLGPKFKDVTGYPTLQLYNSETGQLLMPNIVDNIIENRTVPYLPRTNNEIQILG